MKKAFISVFCVLAMAGFAVADADIEFKGKDSGAFIEVNGEMAPLKAMPLGVEPKIQMESHEQSNAKGTRGICDFRMVCNDANQEKVWYINDVPDFSPAAYNTLKMVVRSANYRRVSMEIWLNTPNGWYVSTYNNASDLWCLYAINIGGIPVNITHIALAISESSSKQGENEANFHYLQLDYMEIRNASSVFWSHEFSSATGWSYYSASSVGSGEYSFTARTVEDVFTYAMVTGTSANTSWSKAFRIARSYTISDTIFRDEYFADGAHYLGFMYMVDNANYFVKALNTNGKTYTDVKNEIQGFPAIVAVSQGLDQYAQDIMPSYAESQVSAGHAVIYHEQNIYKNQQSAIAVVGNNTTVLNEATEIFAPLMKETVKAMPVAMNNTGVQNAIAPAARDNAAMDEFNLAMDLIAAKSEATLGVAAAYAKTTGSGLSVYDTKVLGTYLKIHAGILMAIPIALNAIQIKEGYDTNNPAKIKSGSASIIDMGVGTAISVKAGAVAVSAGVAAAPAAAIAVGAALAYTGGNMVVESRTGNSIGGHVYNAASYVKNDPGGVAASVVNSSTAVSNTLNNTSARIVTAVSNAPTTARTVYNTAATAVSTAINNAVTKVTNVANGIKKWMGVGDYFYEDYNATIGLHSVYILVATFSDNFNDGNDNGWTRSVGTWAVESGEYSQSNTSNTNTNSYAAVSQSGALNYEWKVKYVSGACAGLHIYCSSPTGGDRGNSYLIWQDGSYVKIYEAINNTLYSRASVSASNAAGQTHTYKATYQPATGQIKVYRDGGTTPVVSWTDSSPLTSGSYISLRTNATHAHFDNVSVVPAANGPKSNGAPSGDKVVAAEQTMTIHDVPLLLSCAPKPLTHHTNISYQLASPADVSLKVYNISGQLVRILTSEFKPAGYHSVRWDGRDASGNKVAAGVYLYRMQAGDYSATNKLTVLK